MQEKLENYLFTFLKRKSFNSIQSSLAETCRTNFGVRLSRWSLLVRKLICLVRLSPTQSTTRMHRESKYSTNWKVTYHMQEGEKIKKMQFFVPNLQSCLGPNFLHKLPGEFAMSTIRHELQRFNKKSRIGNWQHCCSHGKYFIF